MDWLSTHRTWLHLLALGKHHGHTATAPGPAPRALPGRQVCALTAGKPSLAAALSEQRGSLPYD